MDPLSPKEQKKQESGVGPMAGIIIVVIVLLLGGLYFLLMETTEQIPTEQIPHTTGETHAGNF